MYKNFTETNDGGYALKKQGMITTVLIGAVLAAVAIFLFKAYIERHDGSMLMYALLMLLFCFFMIWKSTKQFIIYPKQKIFKYSKGKGSAFTEFRFDELAGANQQKTKNMYGITTGTSYKLGFEQNGKYKEILLGQNVSAKTMRGISEEMTEIMELN